MVESGDSSPRHANILFKDGMKSEQASMCRHAEQLMHESLDLNRIGTVDVMVELTWRGCDCQHVCRIKGPSQHQASAVVYIDDDTIL